jgi:heme a synthase
MSEALNDRWVRRVGLIAIIAVYFLILVGGTVRATGAGMGCPDWPLCFGQWIPPTHESQLPADWRIKYADRGYDTAPFDATKTWIEYVNRLVGASIGLIILTFVFVAAKFRQKDPPVFYAAVIALLAVLFNAWLGSKVVSTNLKPVMISLHMTGAFLVQMALIYATTRAARDHLSASLQGALPDWFRHIILLTLAALVFQVISGLQIRESVDWISRNVTDASRHDWLEHVPAIFYVHRSFSWVVLGLALFLIYKIMKSPWRKTAAGLASYALVGLIVFEMLLGGALNHLGFPAVAQPVHLLVAHLIFGVLWFQWCLLATSSSSSFNRNAYV